MPNHDEPEAIDARAICKCGHAFGIHSKNSNLAYRICCHHDRNGKYCPCGRFRLGEEPAALPKPKKRARPAA
jgi:hypothetical protein